MKKNKRIKTISCMLLLTTYCLPFLSYSQNESCRSKNVIILNEKHIDSLFYFRNPLVNDPMLIKTKSQNNLWKKSFRSSSLGGFLNLNFNSTFFCPRFFGDYDFFQLLPDSYILCPYVDMIKEMVFPLTDSVTQKRILDLPMILDYIQIDKGVQEKKYNGYPYFIYHYTTSSFLEVSVNVSYYNELFSRYVLTDPPSCLFCDKSFRDMMYIKILIPMSDRMQKQ